MILRSSSLIHTTPTPRNLLENTPQASNEKTTEAHDRGQLRVQAQSEQKSHTYTGPTENPLKIRTIKALGKRGFHVVIVIERQINFRVRPRYMMIPFPTRRIKNNLKL